MTFAILQLIGGFILVASYLPQIIKIHKTKSSQDISLMFTGLVVAGVGFSLFYSTWLLVVKQEPWVFITNVITLIEATWLFIVALHYKKKC